MWKGLYTFPLSTTPVGSPPRSPPATDHTSEIYVPNIKIDIRIIASVERNILGHIPEFKWDILKWSIQTKTLSEVHLLLFSFMTTLLHDNFKDIMWSDFYFVLFFPHVHSLPLSHMAFWYHEWNLFYFFFIFHFLSQMWCSTLVIRLSRSLCNVLLFVSLSLVLLMQMLPVWLAIHLLIQEDRGWCKNLSSPTVL